MKKKLKDFTIEEAINFCHKRQRVCEDCPFNNLACGVLRCQRYSKDELNQEVEIDD